MVCDIVSTKEVLNRSLERAEKLKKVMDKTAEGELLSNTIAVAKKAIKLLDSRNFSELSTLAREELSSDIATMTLNEKLGGEISASVGINPKIDSVREIYTFKSAKHIESDEHGDMLEIKVTDSKGNWGTYTFKKGNSRSNPTSSNNVVMMSPKLGMLITSTINAVKGVNAEMDRAKNAKASRAGIAKARQILDSAKSVDELLKNSENLDEAVFDYKRASKIKDYNHGSVEDMRNTLADLHAIGGRPVSDKHYTYYDNLLKSMHPHFFRDMNLYIDDSADDAAGWVDVGKKDILINATTNTDTGMGNAEVYMHEVIHTMTTWALNSKSNKADDLRTRLNYLRDKAYKSITWKDLMMADDKLSIKGAKERFDYIFNSKNADDEFLAFAMTNPAFMSLLEKIEIKDERKGGLLNSIKNLFADMLNAVMGNYKFANRNSTMTAEIHSLVNALAEINNAAETELSTNANILTQAGEAVSRAEGKIEEFMYVVAGKLFDTEGAVQPIPKNPSHVQKVMFYAKFFFKSLYNSNHRHEAGHYFTLLKLDARSSIREIMRSILPGVTDHLTTEAEFLSLQASNIDLARNNRVAYAGESIIKGFKKTLTKEEEDALTLLVMESNAQTLFTSDKNNGKGYSDKQLADLLGDYSKRAVAINKLKRRIKKAGRERGNWLVGQAEGLGIYMATGKGHKAQNSNSSNIVRGYLTSERHKEDKELLSMVQELASLTAINHQKPSDQKLVQNLLLKESEGVKNVVNLYGAFIKESENSLFKGDASHIMEGYARELFDDKIETAYAVMSKKEEMETQGFKLVSEFESNDVSGAEAIGYFVSDTYTRPEKLSGAIGLGNPNSRGMTLKEARYAQFHDSVKHAHVWFEADKLKHDAEAVEINKKLADGVPVSDIENGAVPILDAQGYAVDYRNMMPKSDKAKFLNQNRSIIDVLAKTIGSVVDKDERAKLNDKVEELIVRQIRDVYDNPSSKDNLLEHTLIGPKHVNPEIRKLFYQLPKNLQKIANGRADNALPIPDILLDTYFGYSQVRTTDAPGIKQLPNAIKRILNAIESVWIDIVKIAKGNILLKMPAVLVVNVISNILFAVSTGTNPLDLVKDYSRSIKDVHRFMQTHKKWEAAKVELSSFTQMYHTTRFKSRDEVKSYNDEVKRLKDSVLRYEKEMEASHVKELFDLGMYQAVIEDVNMYKLGDTNAVVDSIDGVVGKLPTVVKTPLQWLYLSKETKWYQANQYILQMSDLVARDVMNRKQKAIEVKQADGKRDIPYEYRKSINKLDMKGPLKGAEREAFLEAAKKSRQTNLLRYFINYNLPNGRGEEYLNRIGILMFTKYVKRIQRVISDVGVKHPINSALTLLGAGFALDLEMIQDQSFFVKGGDDYGVFGLTPVHNPVDVLMTVVNPPLINLGESLIGSN